MKVCRGCKKEKKDSKFNLHDYIRKDGTRGLRSHCNTCRSAGARKWYSSHKEQAKASKQTYVENNAEVVAERRLRYSATHIEENRARATTWYKDNSERGKANAKVANHKRRARIAKVGGSFTTSDIRNLYTSQGGLCYYCSISIEEMCHIEHMTPISKGGSNWIDNICLACIPCNRTKGVKTAEEFMNG